MEENREKPIIRLEGLGKQFQTSGGPVTALEDINLEIRYGEVFGIIGLSGAGKSTLVRCINYLEVPTSGISGPALRRTEAEGGDCTGHGHQPQSASV